MKLIVISPEPADARELAVLPSLFAAGLERYHVRRPAASRPELRAWLKSVPSEFWPRLVLHQHHDLVAEFGLGGRHWRDDGSAPLAPSTDFGFTSRSCHDLAGLRAAFGGYDAVFFGPVFPSISKPGHARSGKWSPEELRELLTRRTDAERRTAVIALGGIDAQHALVCRDLGFDDVAALGAVWQASDPVAAFAQLQTSLARHAA